VAAEEEPVESALPTVVSLVVDPDPDPDPVPDPVVVPDAVVFPKVADPVVEVFPVVATVAPPDVVWGALQELMAWLGVSHLLASAEVVTVSQAVWQSLSVQRRVLRVLPAQVNWVLL